MGLDNWIWGTVGYSGFNGIVGGNRHKFGMGVFRFKPDGSEMEFVRSSNNNTWGLGLSEEGIVFGSTANRNASWYMAVPNRFYEQVQGWSAARMETIADSQGIFPITRKVRQVDQHGLYTAGAGHALYTARAFPKEYWNRMSFVTEPTGHLVGWFRLDAAGAEMPPQQALAQAVAAALREEVNIKDKWIREAATCAAARNHEDFIPLLLASGPSSSAELTGLTRIVAAITRVKHPTRPFPPRSPRSRMCRRLRSGLFWMGSSPAGPRPRITRPMIKSALCSKGSCNRETRTLKRGL